MRLSTGRLLALILMPLLSVSCATHYGSKGVAPSGYSYNNAIAQTKDEQLLLNLVRLRYRDTVVFMEISGVTAQNRYVAGLSSETLLPFNNLSGGAALMIPNLTYSETPTVSYAPLKGAEFANKLLSPISTETIVLLANSGWSIERLLTCCVEQLGELSNAPSASGPTPPNLPDNAEFRSAIQILRKLQIEERVFVEAAPSEATNASQVSLVVDAPVGPDCDRLRALLGVSACMMRFNLAGRRGALSHDELLAQPRTVLGALYALSHAVSVPRQHANQGFVTTSATSADNQTSDWEAFLSGLFSVSASETEPQNAFVKIYYRDHWFWIDDADLDSKTTFNLISFLLSLQSAASDGAAPLLTLSAGR